MGCTRKKGESLENERRGDEIKDTCGEVDHEEEENVSSSPMG